MDRKSDASRRWRMLSDTLKGSPPVSADWNERILHALFSTCIMNNNDDSPEAGEHEECWIKLTPNNPETFINHSLEQKAPVGKSLHLKISKGLHQVDFRHRLKLMSGFDNTGNVHLWASEVILAHALFYPNLYPGIQQVLRSLPTPIHFMCELGAGKTGVAGLSAMYSDYLCVDKVLLTDGNDACVDSLKSIVDFNKHFLHNRGDHDRVSALKLVWPEEPAELNLQEHGLVHTFQFIVAADCLFLSQFHRGFLALIDALLSEDPGSTCIILAPKRGTSLQQFRNLVHQSPNWSLTVLATEEFISAPLLTRIRSVLDGCPADRIADSILGEMVVVRRNIE